MKQEVELKKQRKLQVIDEQDELLKIRVMTNKAKTHEYVDNEKTNVIKRQNEKLTAKLLVISEGKNSTI